MDLKNFSDITNNSSSVIAKPIDRKYTNNENINRSSRTHCKINKGSYRSNFTENTPKKSFFMPTTISSNNAYLSEDSNRQNIFNTETYTTCDVPHVNLPRVHSQIEDAQSSLEAYYLPCSIENLDTLSFQEAYSKFVCSGDQSKCEPNEITLAANKKTYAEKTTYCRPVLNMYNQEFIFKTMERNIKLQRIVKKLIQARQSERRKDDWNNYINDLKNKHHYNDDNQVPQFPEERVSSHIDDYYNTRIGWKRSNPCQNILHGFYDVPGNIDHYANNKSNNDDSQHISNFNPYIFGTNSYCYPTASQGRIQMKNKERVGSSYTDHWQQRSPSRYYRGNTIVIDKDYNKAPNRSRYYPRKLTVNKAVDVHLKTGLVSKSVSIQMDLNLSEGLKSKESFKDKFSAITKKNEILKKKTSKCENEDKQGSLINIENKLNQLITTINTVLVELKTNKTQSNTNTGVNCKFSDERMLSFAKSDTFGLTSKLEDVTYAHNVTKSTIGLTDVSSSRKHYESNMSKINEILNEEIDKSNKIKQDIERMLNNKSEKPCSVQITFDLPTKERSTEVTASLSKTKAKSNLEKTVIIEEIDPRRNDERRMTIAVNTEPLGLLALLRISTDTVKQMLSCMPNIDYYSYLSMLQPLSRSTVSHYICNICGAAFGRPSQLSDHIQEHNLGKTRDCCVCRHVLNSHRYPNGLFTCKHCGQRFTRAYCCELHQQTCAKAPEAKRDVNSELLILT